MGRITGSLLFRIAALFLLGLLALQMTILLAAMWPDGRPIMFRLIAPEDAREIAEAIEQAPPALRPAIAAAASTGPTSVELLAHFPEEMGTGAREGEARPAPWLEERFRRYAEALSGRPLRVQAREGTIFSWNRRPGEPPRGPIRVLIGLRSGEVLAIERAPLALQQLASRYLLVGLVAGAVLLLILLTLLWQVVRPVARLAQATTAFREDIAAPDIVPGGAREVRILGEAFNAMKQRIGALVGERTRMLAAIAHDLRTCLTRLRLRADHIPDDRQRMRAVNDIEEMNRLLEDILLFARAETGPPAPTQTIDARAEALAYVELRQETGDKISFSAAEPAMPCRCAPLAFRRILANLLDNAIRYGARAHLSLRQEDTSIAIVVTDEGAGVPEDMIAQITAPFERLEQSRGRHGGGVGLGLSIVKALAESHGGSLTLESPGDSGLRATVRLPAAAGG
ncbi:two-component system sensor histidine kinase [Sphingobium sp. SYK-6]|uniref:sensor histidine kinase n=1 Tax=Sphingobium sp. (strain NBRC 103272 / SYK-6) TaxID=627192 RepID=UPI0002276D67|nr:HAMP domain-containing sensor histidine kinase [Sphingobium sp. SYK-6]BAK64985.1 two-component system sensor histidine kinase [Sphingobium sp. SYK-6]